MMLSPSLETTLNNVFENARSRGAEFVGLEHLLRGLLDDPACRDVLGASAAEIERLGSALDAHIAASTPDKAERQGDVQPTPAFQRTLQRAVFEVQAAGQRELGSFGVLRALLDECDSSAVRILAEHGFERTALLRRIGDVSPNGARGSEAMGCGVEHSRAHRVVRVRMSESEIEKRLTELEAKLTALADQVSKSIGRGPKSE